MKNALILLLFLSATAFAQTEKRYLKQFVRPANNTTYSAGGVVSNSSGKPFLLVTAGDAPNGKIVGVRMAVDTPNVTNAKFRLFLYSDSIGLGTIADNGAFVNTLTTDSLLIGYADFILETTGTGSGATMAFDGFVGLTVAVDANVRGNKTNGIWGLLTATAAYVPKFSGTVRLVTVVEVR